MKKYMYYPVLVMLLASFSTLRAQNYQKEYLGLPGDNLNLYAVMKLFQESETLEGFERRLNAEDSRINNLDLDGDGYVDYIRVIDNIERNVHFIVLQVAINSRENQDVAVFSVIRESDGEVYVQLVGDEALYGKDYIIEPILAETANPGYMGNGRPVAVTRTTTIEVGAWPLVRFMFMPTYVVWHSPWYYSYYPSYWHPWNSYYWHYYHGYHQNYYSYYYGHYHHHDHYRTPYWRESYYGSRRSYSAHVQNRIQGGQYKSTYSRPETRRQGAALYRKTHPEQSVRSSNSSAGSRRSVSDGTSSRQSTTTGTSRRTGTTGTSRQQSTSTGTSRQQSTSTGTSRQQSTSTRATRQQPASTGNNSQSTTTSPNRRSSPAGTATPSTTQSTKKATTNSGASNSGRRSSSVQSTTPSKSTGKSSSTGVSNSGSSRRSSGGNNATTTEKKTESTKAPKSTSGSGRR